jgi:hypothetical protein
MTGLVENPEYWRGRAEGTRTLAESLKDEGSKKIMLGIAKDFERMAARAEEHLNRRKQNRRSKLDK